MFLPCADRPVDAKKRKKKKKREPETFQLVLYRRLSSSSKEEESRSCCAKRTSSDRLEQAVQERHLPCWGRGGIPRRVSCELPLLVHFLILNRNVCRMSSAEARERERLLQGDPDETYQNIRRAAEVHRQVRAYARKTIKPGMTMTEIAELIENGTRSLVEEIGLKSGVGFPTGLSVNEVAAHYTPNAGDTKGIA